MPEPVVVHFAPHPDDELLGAPATLLALRGAGWRVVNLACSLGRPADVARREIELTEACRRADFELRVPDIARRPGEWNDAKSLRSCVAETLADLNPSIVVSASPHDRHPAHEAVARAIAAELVASESPCRWWMWGLWGDLPLPTLVTEFDEAELVFIAAALDAHGGELDRNDFCALLEARARATAISAAERVFGFGSDGLSSVLAEVISEVAYRSGRWLLGVPQRLNLDSPLAPLSDQDVTRWIEAPSVTTLFGRPGSQRRE